MEPSEQGREEFDAEVFRMIADEQRKRRQRQERLEQEKLGQAIARQKPRKTPAFKPSAPSRAQRTAVLEIKCTAAELDMVHQAARERGMPLRKFILEVCLGKTPPTVDEQETRLRAMEKRLELIDKRLEAGSW